MSQKPRQQNPQTRKTELAKNARFWDKHSFAFIMGILAVLTVAIYGPSLTNGFILTWDDHAYITSNEVIKNLSLENIKSIFTTFYAANYHPLTTLTWAVEFSLFGLNPTYYHGTNLLLHIINIWFVFRFVLHLNKRVELAALVAVLFAIHPLNVEVVAFVSQRKDVLYTMFFLWALNCYVLYKKNPLAKKHVVMCFIFFLCSLLSKSMAVTLPVMLLLIDYYIDHRIDRNLLLTKLPFFLLSTLFGIIAILSQQSYGAIDAISEFSSIDRAFLVNYGVLFYIMKIIAPFHLSAMHGYPLKVDGVLPVYCYISPFVVGIIAWAVWKYRRHYKNVVFGFAFFLIAVTPVLQIIPVGGTLVSERYMYVPGMGIFFLLSTAGVNWMDRLRSHSRNLRLLFKGLTCAIIVLFAGISFGRTKVWKDSFTLWSDVIRKNPHVAVAYYNRGVALFNKKYYLKAIQDYDRAIDIHPTYIDAIRNRGESKEKLQKYGEAIHDYNLVLSMTPDDLDTYLKRSRVKEKQKDFQGAIRDLDMVIDRDNKNAKALLRRARIKSKVFAHAESVRDFDRYLASHPKDAVAYNNRGIVKALMKDYKGALKDFDKAIFLNPDYREAMENRKRAITHLKR